jgi:molybdopterin-synthase adenylyltransferase
METNDLDRYSRQILFRPIGTQGQRKLTASRVAIVGCGALGSHQAMALARGGIGELLIIDRDYVEQSNLQRQCLFTEQDALEANPKALAAAAHLQSFNSQVSIRGTVADLTSQNAVQILEGVDVILDGTDNFEARYLLNDVSILKNIPWVYGAAVGSYGASMTVVPGQGPCLACIFSAAPAGLQPTCDTDGILSVTASAVASIQVAECFKLLTGNAEALHRKLITFDLWENRFQAVNLGAPVPACPACQSREYAYLKTNNSVAVRLCGRNSVQVHEPDRAFDLGALARRLAASGSVRSTAHVIRFAIAEYEMTIFADGRAIIKGTEDPAEARSLYRKYVAPEIAPVPHQPVESPTS